MLAHLLTPFKVGVDPFHYVQRRHLRSELLLLAKDFETLAAEPTGCAGVN